MKNVPADDIAGAKTLKEEKMKKIAFAAAIGSALIAGAAFAYPGMGAGMGPGMMMGPGCGAMQQDRLAWVKSANETMRQMLNIKPEQKAAFDAYAAAGEAYQKERDDLRAQHWNHPATNYQDRLAQRLELEKADVKNLEAFSAARSNLLKVLTPEQKLVLESFDAHHGLGMMGARSQGMKGFHHKGEGKHPGAAAPKKESADKF